MRITRLLAFAVPIVPHAQMRAKHGRAGGFLMRGVKTRPGAA